MKSWCPVIPPPHCIKYKNFGTRNENDILSSEWVLKVISSEARHHIFLVSVDDLLIFASHASHQGYQKWSKWSQIKRGPLHLPMNALPMPEELVRCFSCKIWYRRIEVGISKAAFALLGICSYKHSCTKQILVKEQQFCAWSCDQCITTKVRYWRLKLLIKNFVRIKNHLCS